APSTPAACRLTSSLALHCPNHLLILRLGETRPLLFGTCKDLQCDLSRLKNGDRPARDGVKRRHAQVAVAEPDRPHLGMVGRFGFLHKTSSCSSSFRRTKRLNPSFSATLANQATSTAKSSSACIRSINGWVSSPLMRPPTSSIPFLPSEPT